jgi:16S rRNA (guanine1207-N2)-methyltransferase
MSDQIFNQLVQEMRRCDAPILLVADENFPAAPFASLKNKDITVLTNRYEVYQNVKKAGLKALFNDFIKDSLEQNHYGLVCYRVSKEKPVTHHIINIAFDLLTDNGELVLVGEKNDGIKTYTKKAAAYFDTEATASKDSTTYTAVIQKESSQPGELLDDKNYTELRTIAELDGLELASKPGVFGWNKIDRGSAFLAEHLPKFLKHIPEHATLLDLGCGYGYLTAMAAKENKAARIVATDNNAAAITAIQKNFETLGLSELKMGCDIIAADCGDSIKERFNVIICNPPFHQGYSVDGQLTDKFLTNTKRLLKRSGKALFVINTFIPLPQKAREYFKTVKIIDENTSFKLVMVED